MDLDLYVSVRPSHLEQGCSASDNGAHQFEQAGIYAKQAPKARAWLRVEGVGPTRRPEVVQFFTRVMVGRRGTAHIASAGEGGEVRLR